MIKGVFTQCSGVSIIIASLLFHCYRSPDLCYVGPNFGHSEKYRYLKSEVEVKRRLLAAKR